MALICYFSKEKTLAIVPTKSLKSQMQVLFDKLGFINIEIITRAEYYANPGRYQQKLVFIDEYDETMVEAPYDVKSAYVINGIWDLKNGPKIYAFTATPSSGVDRLTAKIFNHDPRVFKYKSEYEFVTNKDPVNTSIICDSSDDSSQILNLICNEIEFIY
jgi:hypothetical protein